jgi:DNA-binding response OmpR family regulator
MLWIEDDEHVLKWGTELLARFGFGLDVAKTGREGLARLATRRYDLILLDWRLPDIGGAEVLRHIRTDGLGTPVMVCTAYSDDGEEVAARTAGAQDFLVKPLHANAWVARIRALLPPHGHGPAVGGDPIESAPIHERSLEQHHRLLAGDTSAADEIATDFLPILQRRLRRHSSIGDDALIATAATMALMRLFQVPTCYDSQRRPLIAFLELKARRNLRNLRRSIARRLKHEQPMGDQMPEPASEREAKPSRWRDLRFVLAMAKTREERAFLQMWLRGNTRTEALASILGLGHMSLDEQRTAVHRLKERLRRRIAYAAKHRRRS